MSGTVDYLDPIYKAHYLWCQENKLKLTKEELLLVDLFKADIYSLALTFYQVLTGSPTKEIKHINES
jgi:hypothetical protein